MTEMKFKLMGLGFRPSSQSVLDTQLNYMRKLVKEGKLGKAEFIRKKIIDFCGAANLKIPNEVREQDE